MQAFAELIQGMVAGQAWTPGAGEAQALMERVYEERYHQARHHRERYRTRVNLQKQADAASYAGWITADNPSSGPYQGTSFVWFPGREGSVAVLVIGTDGFGADTNILGRPGHARRLKALNRIHGGTLWVKPDLLDLGTAVPDVVSDPWPDISAALRAYKHVIYAAVAVRDASAAPLVSDLLDLFFEEHGTPLTGPAKLSWEARRAEINGAVFPAVDEDQVFAVLAQRRFVVLEGPPGTGKTRLALRLGARVGSTTTIQFHPARTYEDFIVGLSPRPASGGLSFEVKPGDLVRANQQAATRPHLLIIDEINRADLARVLGEALVLFEVGTQREITLPHTIDGSDRLSLSPNLRVVGTRNIADRTIARMDLAIRRRFAFIEVWPDLGVVRDEGDALATALFSDTLHTFAEFADDEVLRLVPGHAYFLDPLPDAPLAGRAGRVRGRLRYELLPLLRDYVSERLCGGATEAISGLADRVEARLQERA